MKYIKMLGLSAMAVAALMAFGASSASALWLTDGSGKHPTTIEATSTEGTLSGAGGAVHIVCEHSYMHGHVTDDGTDDTIVGGIITKLTFTGCGSWTVTVLKPGSLTIDKKSSNEATVTSTGAEVTTESTGGLHCIYTTNGTDIGTLTGSNKTGATAVLDISGAIPRSGGRSGIFCGSTGAWVGNYKITNPDTLKIDSP